MLDKPDPGTLTTLLNWVNCNDMERAAGVSRDSLGISMGTLQGATSDLGGPAGTFTPGA
ncbi:hypothetical protein [Streptomyces sp. NPDC047042]|uniref:hypothetical protein n=1 Tax=Streptomyces sp. NPDC047042 TaxID=3154807 RepID=UPI0033F03439